MYQKSAVEQYSQKYLNPSPFASGQYNDSGNVGILFIFSYRILINCRQARAYPDISANGYAFLFQHLSNNWSRYGCIEGLTTLLVSVSKKKFIDSH